MSLYSGSMMLGASELAWVLSMCLIYELVGLVFVYVVYLSHSMIALRLYVILRYEWSCSIMVPGRPMKVLK